MYSTLQSYYTLLALESVLVDEKGVIQKIFLLFHMSSLQSCRHTCAWVPASIQHVPAVVVLGLIEQGLDSRLSEAPGTGVEGLLLTPDDVLGVWVHVEVLLQLSPREGV